MRAMQKKKKKRKEKEMKRISKLWPQLCLNLKKKHAKVQRLNICKN